MANLYVKAVPSTDLNRNTEWFTYPGVWTTYILILFFSWLMVLSVFGCSPGLAWSIVHLSHSLITYHFFHWKKGTPFADDQGIYNRLTWWEQIDSGKQLTPNRKFLTVVPIVFFISRFCRHFSLLANKEEYVFLVLEAQNVSSGTTIANQANEICSHGRYLIASHTTDYQHPMLFFNTLAVFVLVVAKFPHMHKLILVLQQLAARKNLVDLAGLNGVLPLSLCSHGLSPERIAISARKLVCHPISTVNHLKISRSSVKGLSIIVTNIPNSFHSMASLAATLEQYGLAITDFITLRLAQSFTCQSKTAGADVTNGDRGMVGAFRSE
ncbi:hypothetical protein ACH5RR_038269 [Cinchona calisaya]|uniref:Uncharacterized protein n=1 Tax=Cinchona calisaya TaxID=153742 RepID=A0ABD2XUT5_9GENT